MQQHTTTNPQPHLQHMPTRNDNGIPPQTRLMLPAGQQWHVCQNGFPLVRFKAKSKHLPTGALFPIGTVCLPQVPTVHYPRILPLHCRKLTPVYTGDAHHPQHIVEQQLEQPLRPGAFYTFVPPPLQPPFNPFPTIITWAVEWYHAAPHETTCAAAGRAETC